MYPKNLRPRFEFDIFIFGLLFRSIVYFLEIPAINNNLGYHDTESFNENDDTRSVRFDYDSSCIFMDDHNDVTNDTAHISGGQEISGNGYLMCDSNSSFANTDLIANNFLTLIGKEVKVNDS